MGNADEFILVLGYHERVMKDKRSELVSAYMPLIKHEVSRYIRKLGDIADAMVDDIEQAASLGLVSAYEAFDPDRSPALIPYLRRGIDMAIMKELSENLRLIRQPRGVQTHARALRKALLEAPAADDGDLRIRLSLTQKQLDAAKRSIAADDIYYLDASDDNDNIAMEEEGFEENVLDSIMVDSLRTAIDNLSEDESFIIRSYSGAFGAKKLTAMQIARHFSYSPYLLNVRLEHIMYALSFDLSL